MSDLTIFHCRIKEHPADQEKKARYKCVACKQYFDRVTDYKKHKEAGECPKEKRE